MNYRHIYMLIIEHAKSEQKLGIRVKGNGQYYEKHHILPKSKFPSWSKRKSNLVLLTAREHFFCHQLLTKIYPCREMFGALSAFQMIGDTKRVLSSYQYKICREASSRHASLYMKGRTGSRNSFYGHRHTEESRKKMSDWQKGKSMVEKLGEQRALEFSKKLSLANEGSKNPMYKHVWKDSSKKLISMANSGGKNGMSKSVRNVITGRIYETMSECCKLHHIKPCKLRELLRSHSKYVTRRGEEVQFEVC